MSNIDAESVYTEICQNIRETDAISFKLLNLVPLASTLGGRYTSSISEERITRECSFTRHHICYRVSVFTGSVLVFGLYKWELEHSKM
jgi:hypothetical protein